ncbi:hypothetical protein [Deinococcus radiotolerans]|uniref:PIN domain-containing protein n=1 Tax=Deinococcus radiotolerans TaxID=1309407 RepID=A0ABQ2FQE6_9DEIO|nr:hypothetical protein [Deinococcus radiotolerans]GGL16535.1 hypothetical protein GCM10010844_39260 [Deinococcus radiotolerans]
MLEPRHPRTLPRLTVNLSGRTVVLLIDANVIIKDLRAVVKQPGASPALFELLDAPHGRLVMSAGDVAEVAPGLTRLERTIRLKFPQEADAMWHLWMTRVQDRMLFLDPAGVPDTTLSAAVRAPNRDPDDADLALLGWVLDADGLLTYDGQAFGGLVTTMGTPGVGGHGTYLCAFRDDLRVDEIVAMMVGVPLQVLAVGTVGIHEALKKRGVSPALQAVGALGLGAMLALWPASRAVIGRAVMQYGELTMSMTPTMEVRNQLQEVRARVKPAWPATDDPVIRCARYLVRVRGTQTCTELVTHLKLPLTAGELYGRLQAYPGLFQEQERRRWIIRRTPMTSPSALT